jgi:hypothetical protein
MGQFFEELKRRNVLRVAAAYIVVSWLIIQVVETIFPVFGFGDAGIRFVIIVLAIGLIPALILSWAFEITPEGLKKEKDIDRSQSITPHTGKRLDRMIMVYLIVAPSASRTALGENYEFSSIGAWLLARWRAMVASD